MKTRIIYSFSISLLSIISALSSYANNNDTSYVSNLIDSSFHIMHCDGDKAIRMAKEALDIAKKLNYEKLEIDALNATGLLYYTTLEKIDSGYSFVTKAYEKSMQIKYEKGICNYLYLKGLTETYTENFEQANQYYISALIKAKEIGDNRLIALIYDGMSHVHMRTGNSRQAIEDVKISHSYYEQINDLYELTNTDMKCGYLYMLLDSVQKAKTYYQKAIDLLAEMNDSIRILFPKSYMAMAYVKEKKYYQAIPILKETVSKMKGTKYVDLYSFSCHSLSEIYNKLKNFNQAYLYQREAYRTRDSVYTVEKFNRLFEAQLLYEKSQKEKETGELRSINEIRSLELKNTKNVAIFVCSILLMLTVLFFVISKKHKFARKVDIKLKNQQDLIHQKEKELIEKENERIRQNLEYQKRVLASKVFQLSQNNELGNRLVNSLKSLQLKIKTKGPLGEDLRTHVQNIINEIKFTSNTQMWDEFELYFNEVNPGFINWLSKQYPELTKNEIRLCTFALLNLKTNEISRVTFQNSKTIHVARTRLRKKLGLDNKDISLATYLHRRYSGVQNEIIEI